MVGFALLDGGTRNLSSENPFSVSELMNFDTCSGWCNSPAETDQLFASFGFLSYQSIPQISVDSLNITQQNSGAFAGGGSASSGMVSPYNCRDKIIFQQTATEFGSFSDLANCIITRPLGQSLDEKMLRALSFFKESSGGSILAQVWIPIKQGDQYVLTTSEQPYLLDQVLSGYHESNHAVDHNVRGSIALPVFEPSEMSCCAVLELVTVKEKPNFDSEMENLSSSQMQAVNFRTSAPPKLLPQCLSGNQRAALSEISDVLRAVCHAHRLQLAVTWIPCSFTEGAIDEIIKVCVREGDRGSDGKCILCIEASACYVNEKGVQGFVHACAEHYLEDGQGIAGEALQSNHPFFVSDVKTSDISEYPLVHHALKFDLNAAVAIRLRSTHTGDDDYILEFFFLPISMKGSLEQQLLLNNLSSTMQRNCRTLRTVSDAEQGGRQESKIEFRNGKISNFPPLAMSGRDFEMKLSEDDDLNSNERNPLKVSNAKNGTESDGRGEQVMTELKRQPEKRSTSEKNVSLSVLQ
ncbi:hypothetical protein SLA2020_091320 [Shorea laevis]